MELGDKVSVFYSPTNSECDFYCLNLDISEDEIHRCIARDVFGKYKSDYMHHKIVIYDVKNNVDDIINSIKKLYRIKIEKEEKAVEIEKIIKNELPPETAYINRGEKYEIL